MEHLLSSPVAAIALFMGVVYMVAIYFTQKERAKVQQMKRRRGFTPGWSSGRRHRGRGQGTARGEFKPQWNRERRAPRPDGPRPGPAGERAEEEGGGQPRQLRNPDL